MKPATGRFPFPVEVYSKAAKDLQVLELVKSSWQKIVAADNLPNRPELDPLSRTQILIAMGVTALALLAVTTIWRTWGQVSLLPWQLGLIPCLWGMLLGIGITLASLVIYQLWPDCRQSAEEYMDLVLRPLAWPDLIWLGLLPGLSEEILFRGVMLPALGLNWVGLLVTSLCFGWLHLTGLQHWPYMVWATLVGLALGMSALLTENLLVPIVAHTLVNWLAGSLWKLRVFRRDTGT